MELRRFRADLHIHSCLSPCGELSIYPRKIVERALEEGLEIIALTDHNTAENAAAVLRAAEGTGLTVFPGMELTSEEEVHVLGLFETMEAVLPVQDEVFRKLPEAAENNPFIKDQVIVNEVDEVTGFSRRFLMAATALNVFEIVELIHRNGGLAIASHIDRDAFSLFSQLGFIPPGLALDALEVSSLMSLDRARRVFIADDSLPLVRFSDAHRPEEIGRAWTEFRLAAKTWDELRLAMKGSGGKEGLPLMMEDLSLHVLDIAENSIAAGATRVAIFINENERRDVLTILVRDNGRGMSRRTLRRALDPFFSTKGKATGLGLPFLAQAAEQSGGRLSIQTAPGQGTKVTARFRFHHIDRPPLTRMAATLAALIFGHADVGFFYRHRRNGLVFRYDHKLSPTTTGISSELIGSVTGELRAGLKRIGRS